MYEKYLLSSSDLPEAVGLGSIALERATSSGNNNQWAFGKIPSVIVIYRNK